MVSHSFVRFLGLHLFLLKHSKKPPKHQPKSSKCGLFFNCSVGVSCGGCGALLSSFLRVGVDLDEDPELGGGSFQVLQGVRMQT